MPTSVLWMGGIAAFLGFFIGSITPNDEYAASKFDLRGALLWALAGATFAGGLTLFAADTHVYNGLYAAGFGAVIAIFRLVATRGPRVPRNNDLPDGITRGQGASSKEKFKYVERLYKNASFHRDNYYATRSPRDWRYGDSGINAEDLQMLAESLKTAYDNVFGILLILVRELPSEPGEPAVIVVRGSKDLRACKVENGALTVVGCEAPIPAATIAGVIGYAWR